LKKTVTIRHKQTGELIAQGPLGWGITPFEGNYYIRNKYLRSKGFKLSFIPGLCPYKFLYFWLHFHREDGKIDKMLGWKYIFPNPMFPFIWFRVAVPQNHTELAIDKM